MLFAHYHAHTSNYHCHHHHHRYQCIDVKHSRPDWPRDQNFGLGLSLDKLATASSIWPRPGLGLVNLASKNVLTSANYHLLYPFCGCITATFFTKTWLSTLMWDTNSFMCNWHCCHVFLFRNICMWPASTLVSASKTRPRGSGHDLGRSCGLCVMASF